TIGWSRRQLYRKLKAVMNQTPERFIYIVKLEFARQQLQTTSSSISEIAFQAGFSSPAHFSKLFREYFEVTPRMYRKTAGKGSSRGKSEGMINKGPIIQK
ncbi:MAG: AraC family transcriptional regulator, partial [Calditrichaeota bacterium]